MQWYRIEGFACPRCKQKLAVHGAQVDRAEIVTCQDCNQDVLLLRKGQAERHRDRADRDCVLLELPA